MRGKANEGLILYKRHRSASCPVHQQMRLGPAAKRFYFECPCPFWIEGRMPGTGDLVPRQSIGVSTQKEAEAYRDAQIAARTKAARSDAAHGPTLAECVDKYIASREHEVSSKTLGQWRLLLGRLQRFCAARNTIYARGLTVDLIETFKTEGLPDLASTSRGTAVAKLRCFLRSAYKRDWISEPLVDRIATHRSVYEQKEPFTDEEVVKILDEAEKLKGGTHGYAKHPQTFRMLLELMLVTGMRVGDAIRFNPAVLVWEDPLWTYGYVPQKQRRVEQPKHAEAYITDALKRRIDECVWLTPGKRPFYYGSSKNPAYLANEVYERMKTVGSRCGVPDCRPHRLRDTFAIRQLLGGMQLEDVSRLLNHSSIRVTELYYAKWVSARKRRLRNLLAQSLMNTEGHALRD